LFSAGAGYTKNMISEIVIQNFKSYKNTTLKLAPLTLLVGANASGKSNAIEAIRFLSWLADGRRIDDILDSIQREDISIRGFSRDLIYDQASTPTLTLGCALTDSDEWKRLEISLNLEDGTEPSVITESIRSDTNPVPLYHREGVDQNDDRYIAVYYNNLKNGKNVSDNKVYLPLLYSPKQMLLPHLQYITNSLLYEHTHLSAYNREI